MKFDVCVMNPPYNGNIFIDFIKQSLKMCDYVSCITPSYWYADDISLQQTIMQGNHLTAVYDFVNPKYVFGPDVKIGGVNAFIWKRNHNGSCKLYNTFGYDGMEKDGREPLKVSGELSMFNDLEKEVLGENSGFTDKVIRDVYGVEVIGTLLRYCKESNSRWHIDKRNNTNKKWSAVICKRIDSGRAVRKCDNTLANVRGIKVCKWDEVGTGKLVIRDCDTEIEAIYWELIAASKLFRYVTYCLGGSSTRAEMSIYSVFPDMSNLINKLMRDKIVLTDEVLFDYFGISEQCREYMNTMFSDVYVFSADDGADLNLQEMEEARLRKLLDEESAVEAVE